MARSRYAAALFVLGAATATLAQAHARLVASDPTAGSVLAAAPTQIRLTFNESVERAFSKIQLTNASHVPIALRPGAGQPAPQVLSATPPPLPSGTYHVQWTAMTRDSHKVKGEFTFRVK